ncbi:MAG: hypothetical protein ABIQ86_16760 [Steroidobacteraceae bacterium]
MNAPDDRWDDARIHAYVDGELDTFTAARLEAACRQDAMLNARVERQRRLRTTLAASFDPVLDEPVPARLLQAVKTAPATSVVTPIRAVRPRRAPGPPVWLGALAASLVIGLAVGWFAPRSAGLPIAAGSGGLIATGYLDTALSQALSTDARRGASVQVALSFRSSDGAWCRSFSLAAGADGLACRTATGWRVEVLGQPPAPQAGGDYRQAGSSLSGAVLTAISERQAGDTLTLEQERQLREAGWRDAPGAAP